MSDIVCDTTFERGITLATIDHYSKRFAGIFTKRACEILISLGCADDTIYWYDHINNPYRWTPKEILLGDYMHKWGAKTIEPIEFIGGPPSHIKKYKGSLLTMLLDRITTVVLIEGLKGLDNIILLDENYAK